MVDAPTGRVALIFTDVQDSSVLWDRTPGPMHQALQIHDALLRGLIEELGCYEVKVQGDAFMIAAPDVGLALAWCIEAQRRLIGAKWPEILLEKPSGAEQRSAAGELLFNGLRVRMGVHVGTPKARQDPTTGRMDYFGGVVNRAARVAQAGHGGQILISDDAFADWVEGPDAVSRDLGVHRLRGLRREEHLRQVLPAELVERRFPPIVTLGQRIAALPVTRDSFYGRTNDLESIAAVFGDGHRLVTVAGPGGIGKTRLALRFGELHGEDYDGGVWFADLAAARSLDGVLREIARCLGVSLTGLDVAAEIEQLGHAIAGRGEALLILDNAEQVAVDLSACLEAWHRRSGLTLFLVTSQRRLAISFESIHELLPLEHDEAIALFIDRAGRANPALEFDDDTRAFVGRVVERLDCVPLAVTFAAARTDMLSPKELAERLHASFEVLTAPPTLPARRHAALRNVVEWSWSMLTEWEQAALAQCAVFRGGFYLKEAEQVIDLSGFADAPTTLAALCALRDRSLIRVGAAPELRSEPRFSIYAVIVAHAESELEAIDQAAAARRRHAEAYVTLGAALVEKAGGVDAREALDLLAVELDNLLAVWRRFSASDQTLAARAARCLTRVLQVRGPLLLLRTVLESDPETADWRNGLDPVSSALRLARADLLRIGGDLPQCMAELDGLRTGAQESGDRLLQGEILARLGICARDEGRRDDAEDLLAEGLEHMEAVGGPIEQARIINNIAVLHIELGRSVHAEIYQRKTVELLREAGDHERLAGALCNIGTLCMDRGDLLDADGYYQDALTLSQSIGHGEGQAMILTNMGTLYWLLGQRDQADGLYQRALAQLRAAGSRRAEGYVLALLGGLTADKGQPERALLRLGHAQGVIAEIGDPVGMALVDASHAFIDLAHARQLHGRGELPMARKAKADASARIEKLHCADARFGTGPRGVSSPVDASDDVRAVTRLFERSVSELPRLRSGIIGGAAALRRLVPWEEDMHAEDTAIDGDPFEDTFD
jgi:predicted ATPase/class 3 adenylate cyclase